APVAAMLQSDRAYADYDLGRSTRIDAATVQADNNDDYVVSTSEDGRAFRELWIARPVASPGLRSRSTEGLAGQGRYVRLSARGGDGVFSVTELQIWSGGPPAALPPSPEVLAARVRTQLIYLVLALGVVLFATRRASPRRQVGLLWMLPAAAAL